MEHTTLRITIGRIAAAVVVIAISIACLYFIGTYGKMWPWYVDAGLLIGIGLMMYALSLNSCHTKWGKYFHVPLLIMGVLVMLPLGVSSITTRLPWENLTPLMIFIFNIRSYIFGGLIVSQLILCIAAWFYCTSTAALAGIIYSASELYLSLVNWGAPYVVYSLHLDIRPETISVLCSLLLYVMLFALSYVLQKSSHALAFVVRCIAVSFFGIKMLALLNLLGLKNALWLIIWSLANGLLFAFGLRMRDYAIVVSTLLLFVLFVSMLIW